MSTLSAQELHEQGVRYYYGNGVEADDKKAKQWFIDQYEYAGCGALLLKIRFGKAFDYHAATHHAKLAKNTKKNCYETSKNKSLWHVI